VPSLFRIKGRPADETYLFDENPDPSKYEEVKSAKADADADTEESA
jgi:hypothetical protein